MLKIDFRKIKHGELFDKYEIEQIDNNVEE
jgi:hypothetical protein